MKIEELMENTQLSKKITRKILLIITFTVALIFAVFHLDKLRDMAAYLTGILMPFLVGIAIAFVLNVFVKLFENRIFSPLNKKNFKLWRHIRRPLSVVLSFLIVFLIVCFIIFFVLPEIASSIREFTVNLPEYLRRLSVQVTAWMNELNITQDFINTIRIDWSAVISQATQFTTDFMGSLVNVTMSVASGVISLVLSIIFSIYMLIGKEKLTKNLKRVLYAYLPKEKARRTVEVATLSNRIFSGFVAGQLTEALIIGVLCYIGMSIIGFPYALLISSVVCITSVVPILGAYLGGAVGGFILLLIDPMKCLWFLIFLVLLQQFEGNVIYPRVVGTMISLPGIWVLLAILVCGGILGIGGVLLGVPAASVVYTLIRTSTRDRLRKKRISDSEIESNEVT